MCSENAFGIFLQLSERKRRACSQKASKASWVWPCFPRHTGKTLWYSRAWVQEMLALEPRPSSASSIICISFSSPLSISSYKTETLKKKKKKERNVDTASTSSLGRGKDQMSHDYNMAQVPYQVRHELCFWSKIIQLGLEFWSFD